MSIKSPCFHRSGVSWIPTLMLFQRQKHPSLKVLVISSQLFPCSGPHFPSPSCPQTVGYISRYATHIATDRDAQVSNATQQMLWANKTALPTSLQGSLLVISLCWQTSRQNPLKFCGGLRCLHNGASKFQQGGDSSGS